MTPFELESELSKLLAHRILRSVMIWGPPGVGKSSIVADIASKANLELIDLRLSQLAPTDLRGLPVADSAVARWLPPDFLPTTGNGILFLDELNMAPPAIQGIAQQLILNRKVGNYHLPEGWFVWAAGNRKEDRAAVFDMPAPLANRFLHYSVEPHFDSFRSWAARRGIHEQILAFLAFRPALLHQPDAKFPAWPSPRSWEMASELHEIGLPVNAAVGEGPTGEFAAFRKVYERLPNLESILEGNGASTVFPKEPSMRYAVTIGLSTRSNGAEATHNGFSWLLDKSAPEWVQLFLHTVHERALAQGHIGLLATLLKKDSRMKKFFQNLQSPAKP